MLMTIKCDECKDTFEHVTSHNKSGGPKKKICDYCLRKKRNKANLERYHSHKRSCGPKNWRE